MDEYDINVEGISSDGYELSTETYIISASLSAALNPFEQEVWIVSLHHMYMPGAVLYIQDRKSALRAVLAFRIIVNSIDDE